MNDSVTIFMEIALEVIIATIIIGAIVSTSNLITVAMVVYQKDVDSNYQMELYNKYAKYDDTIVSGADIISSIFLYADVDFKIEVDSNIYTNPSVSIEILESVIDPIADYNASLILDTNDAIVGIKFN